MVNVSLHLQMALESSLFCLQVECRDAGELAGWHTQSDLTFILMMEVLDNCPHDRVHRDQTTGQWQQTHVLEEPSQVSTLVFVRGLEQKERILISPERTSRLY